MRLLGDEPEVAAVGRQRQVAEVGAVGRHPPGGRVVEAGQELDDRRLAGARPADEGHGLPRPDGQVDPGEGPASTSGGHPRAPGAAGLAVAEPHRLEAERPGEVLGRECARGVGGAHRGAEELGQFHRRRPGLLVGVEHLGQLLDGSEEEVEVEDEGDEVGGGERTGPDECGPVGHDQRGGHLAEELDGREVRRGEAVALEAGVEMLAGQGPELLEVAAFPGEGGHDPGAREALLQAGHDEGDLVADAEVGPVGGAAEPDGEPEERRDDRQGDERQPPVEHEQHDGHAGGGEAAGHEVDDALLEQLGEGLDVARHPGEDPPTQLPLVEVEAEPAEVGEDLDPQRVEEPLRQAAGPPGAGPQRPPVDEDDGGEDEGGGGEPGGGVTGHAPGDAGPHQGRAGQAGQGVDGHQGDADGQPRPERPHELAEGEARVGPGRRHGVDAGLVVGRRQRRHLGQQLLVGRHSPRQREMPSVRRRAGSGAAGPADPRRRHVPPPRTGRRDEAGLVSGGFAAPPGAPSPGSGGEGVLKAQSRTVNRACGFSTPWGPCPAPGRVPVGAWR